MRSIGLVLGLLWITRSIQGLVGDRRQLDFDEGRDRVGDYTLATAQRQLDEVLDGDGTDLVIALGARSVCVGLLSPTWSWLGSGSPWRY